MVYLLKNECGCALVIAEAESQAEADAFGFDHFTEYCGRSVEIDEDSKKEAEQFWGVASVNVSRQKFKTSVAICEPPPVLKPRPSGGQRSLARRRPRRNSYSVRIILFEFTKAWSHVLAGARMVLGTLKS